MQSKKNSPYLCADSVPTPEIRCPLQDIADAEHRRCCELDHPCAAFSTHPMMVPSESAGATADVIVEGSLTELPNSNVAHRPLRIISDQNPTHSFV
jgi:hypothetical protein